MAEMKKDALNLVYSSDFSITGLQEQAINLKLTPATQSSTTLYGTVKDGETPIPNATVKVFDSDGNPYRHTLTDEKGEYVFEGIPTGSYSIGVAKKHYRMSDSKGAVLSDNSTIEIDVSMTLDRTLSLGAIAGVLTTNDNGKIKRLGNAKITLIDSQKVAVAVTYTVDDGEFAFYDVDEGTYTIIASADGYLASTPMIVTITSNVIVNLELKLEVDTRTNNGTVNGTIRDDKGNIVNGCFVGLYQVTTDEMGKQKETLIAATKTNAAGQYLFGNVVDGKYIVKAKMNQ